MSFRTKYHPVINSKQYSQHGSTKETESMDHPDKPIMYFGSEAENWRGAYTRTGQETPQPKYSPIIIMSSLATFMIYFCILREPNDLDDNLSRDLLDHFGDEASRLGKAYQYNMKNNLPTTEIIERLRDIGAPVPPQARQPPRH